MGIQTQGCGHGLAMCRTIGLGCRDMVMVIFLGAGCDLGTWALDGGLQRGRQHFLFTLDHRYRCITQQFFRKADGVIVMYDLTSRQSFLSVRQWLSTVEVRDLSHFGSTWVSSPPRSSLTT